MSVDFEKLWTASTAILPDYEMMLWRLLSCLDEELAPLMEWSKAAEGRSRLSDLEIYRRNNYQLKIKAIEVFRRELMVADPTMIGFLFGRSVALATLGLG